MNIVAQIITSLAFTRKGRKIITNIIVGILVFFGIIIGSIISLLTAPTAQLSGFFGEDKLTGIESLQENYSSYAISPPIVDSLNIKITGAYPWPLNGILTSEYGWRTIGGERNFHQGIDISTGADDAIIAIADGTIECVNIDKEGYGLYILIRHVDGFYTLSAHLAKSYVKEGDRVIKGQTIGLEGGGKDDPYPGNSTGKHLHFEVRKTADERSRVDPFMFIDN